MTIILSALLGSVTPLYAIITQEHISQEDYYPAGTMVSVSLDNFGNNSFTVGNTGGSVLWEITEKVWWDDVANQTIISYTAFNDAFPLNITSIHIPVAPGFLAASVVAPSGWAGAQVGNEIIWQTTGPGIPTFESLDTMIVRYPGLQRIIFMPNATVDFADGSVLANVNWVVSTVPEPAALSLLVLGGLLALRRRSAS